MRTRRLFAHKRRAAVLLVAVAVAVAGFSASAATAPAAGGGELVVGATAPVGTPIADTGGIFSALKAGAAAVNARGGINGKKVKVWTCNNQAQAAQELACARKAVSEGVDVMIGDSNSFSDAPFGKILADAGIPEVSNTGAFATGFRGPTTFPAIWQLGTILVCASKPMAKQAGGKKVVYVSNAPAPLQALVSSLTHQAAKRQGQTMLSDITIPLTTADWAPVVARAQQSGANTVLLGLLGAGTQAFIRAASAANARFSICAPLGLSGQGGFYNLGSAAGRTYVGSDFQSLSTKSTEMRRFRSEMGAQEKRGDKYASISPKTFVPQVMETWLGLQVVLQAAKTVKGDLTRSSMLKAIKTHKKYTFGGIIPDFTFRARPLSGANSPVPVARQFLHVWNSDAFLWKWHPGPNNFTVVGRVRDTFELVRK